MFMNYFLLMYIVSTRRKNTMKILVKHLSCETISSKVRYILYCVLLSIKFKQSYDKTGLEYILLKYISQILQRPDYERKS